MNLTQSVPNVNVAAHTDTPLVTDFYTANNPCLFCECGNRGTTICNEASSPRVLTITTREAHSGTRYTIGTANGHGDDFRPIHGHSNYTMPCAALSAAAKLSHSDAMPVKFTPIDGLDWNAINREVSARLYAAGFAAYADSDGDAERGWCNVEQRIYAGSVTATRAINIHPARILDNDVTRQGWDAAAALDEADAVLGAEGFAYDTDVDGEPVEDVIESADVDGCTITLCQVAGGYMVETFLMTPERTPRIVDFDTALSIYNIMVEEEQAAAADVEAERANLPTVDMMTDSIALAEIPF